MVSFLSALREFFGRVDARLPSVRIDDPDRLRQFLESRASHVTQTSLYGYLRTRAGSRYPQLFANDNFAKAINAAKWNIWLASVSDLSIYAGGLMAKARPDEQSEVARLMNMVVDRILQAGPPAEADSEYPLLAAGVRNRVASCHWDTVTDTEAAFAESPEAVVRWAPIVDQLKELDADIVRNSVRFRWQEVRRELRQQLDADSLLARAGTGDGRGNDMPVTGR